MSNNTKLCEFCSYSWKPRTAQPLSCPRCKRRFDYKIAQEVLSRLEQEFSLNLRGDH